MPRKIKAKKPKTVGLKQKQKQSIVINIGNKGRKQRPKIVRTASTGGSLGTTTLYSSPLQLPLYNTDHNSLQTLNEGLTNAFQSLQNVIRTERYNQPALNIQKNKEGDFLSLDEVRLSATTPLVPVPVLSPVFKPHSSPIKQESLPPPPYEERVRVIPRRTRVAGNQVKNPITGRQINIGGNIYNDLIAKGHKF